jgi:sugar/nucleoside kinase (ribokinase family)
MTRIGMVNSTGSGADGATGAAPVVLCVGLTTLDTVYTVAHHPGPDEKITAARQDLSAGGPAANAAVTAAALGARTTLVTALGSHPLAAVALRDVEDHGVTVLDAAPGDNTAPALSSVYVQPATARRSVVSVNAADRIVAAPAALTGLVGDADAVLVDGHHPELVRAALEAARSDTAWAGHTILDGGSWKPHLDALLELVDWAVCGERFRVPGAAPSGEGEADTTEELLSRGVSLVAFTHGPRPVTWRTAEDAGTVEVPRVHAMDTLGAGDAFHGAVAHGLAARRPDRPASPEVIQAVLRRAAEVAALRVTSLGTRAWLRDLGRAARR